MNITDWLSTVATSQAAGTLYLLLGAVAVAAWRARRQRDDGKPDVDPAPEPRDDQRTAVACAAEPAGSEAPPNCLICGLLRVRWPEHAWLHRDKGGPEPCLPGEADYEPPAVAGRRTRRRRLAPPPPTNPAETVSAVKEG